MFPDSESTTVKAFVVTLSENYGIFCHFVGYDKGFYGILKKFKNNFRGILDNFNLRPKNLREASFIKKNRKLSLIKEIEFTENEEQESFTIKSKKFNRDSDIVKRTQKSKRKDNLIYH